MEKLEYTTWHPGDDWPFIIAKRAPNWKYYDLNGNQVTKEYLNERGIFIEDK